MKRIIYFLFLVAMVCQCTQTSRFRETDGERLVVPPSYLSVDVNLPVVELEQLLQEKLPDRLLTEKPVLLNSRKKDTLFLTIDRYGKVDMAYRQGELYIALPLSVKAVISKKVLGIRLKNDGNPLEFRAIARISTQVDLGPDWEMQFDCTWQSLEWEKKPFFRLMGFSLDLTTILDEQILKHSVELEEIICREASKKVDFSKVVRKVFHDIQKPNRIAKKPVELYLSSVASDFRGVLDKTRKDTICMHAELQAQIQIGLSDQKAQSDFKSLPGRSSPINQRNALAAFVECSISHKELQQILNSILEGQEFTFKGYDLRVRADSITSRSGRLIMIFGVHGDVTGQVSLSGVPSLSEDLMFNVESFKYELIDTEEEWLAVTDFTLHSALEQYLDKILQVDALGFFNSIDQKAMKGIKNSRLGEKVDVSMYFSEIRPYQTAVSPAGTQFILQVTGSASVTLRKGIFEKRPK